MALLLTSCATNHASNFDDAGNGVLIREGSTKYYCFQEARLNGGKLAWPTRGRFHRFPSSFNIRDDKHAKDTVYRLNLIKFWLKLV